MLRRGAVVLVACAALLMSAADADAAAPANDAFGSAQVVHVGDNVSGTNAEATGEPGEPDVDSSSLKSGCTTPTTPTASCQSSVWYSLTPTEDGPVNLAVGCGHNMEAYTGHTLATLGGADSARNFSCAGAPGEAGIPREAAFDAIKGLTYWIAVTGRGLAGDDPGFTLRVAGAPDTLINGGNARQGSTASFSVTSGNRDATFECALDGAAFTPCSSSPSFTGLSDGGHTFAVRAIAGGHADPTPSQRSFTVDTAAPPLTLVSSVPVNGGTITGANPAKFTTSTTATDVQTVQCSVDGAAYAYCGSPEADIDVQCNGSHSIRLRAVDTTGNAGTPTPMSTFTSSGWINNCLAPVITGTNLRPGSTSASLAVYVQTNGYGTDVALSIAGHPTTHTGLLPGYSVSGAATLNLDDLQPSTGYTLSVTVTSPGGAPVTHDYPFTTVASLPGSASQSVSDITDHEATFNGTVASGPNGPADWFLYFGPTTAYGRFAPFEYAFPSIPGNFTSSFSYRVGGLASDSTVHYRLTTRRSAASVALEAGDLPDATFKTALESSAAPPPAPPAAAPATPGSAAKPPAAVVPAKALTAADVLALPSNKACRSRRTLTLHLKAPKATPIVKAVVNVGARTVKTVRGKALSAGIDLRGLPKGRYTVKVSVTLANGTTLKQARSYRTCTAKRSRS